MNELKVFSDDLIPVYVTDTGNQVVIGRELHESLGIGRDYSNWIKQVSTPDSYMIEDPIERAKAWIR